MLATCRVIEDMNTYRPWLMKSFILFFLSFIVPLVNPKICTGMEPLTEGELSEVCARTGVGILIDHSTFYYSRDHLSFADPDGLPGVGSDSARLNLNGMELDVIRVEALARGGVPIYPPDEYHTQWDARFHPDDSLAVDDYFGSILTFDIVDRLPVMSCASNYHLLGDPYAQGANVAGIHIGLPTLELFVDEVVLESITVSSDDLTPYNLDKSIGRLTAEDVQFDLLGGSFEVAPHQGGGIETSLDDVILFGKAGGLTWFDVDEGGTENSIRSLRIMDLLIDVIRINALTHLDGYGQPQSPGNSLFLTAGTHPGVCNVRQADNYDFTAGNWENRFFSLDMTNALPAMSALAGSGNVAGVYLGIPAMELFMDHMEFVCTVGNDDDELLGKLRLEGLDFVTLEGSLEIAPHSQYGIDIAMDDTVIYLSFDQFAYQDLDDHGEFCINNLEFDTLNINAITLDTLGNATSPGMHGLHLAHLNPAYAPADFSPSPIGIDLCGNLPKMSLEVGHPMAGMSIDLPTMEIYSTEIGIGSVSLHDPDNTAVNNDAPFFQGIRFQDAAHAFLGGRIEIAPH